MKKIGILGIGNLLLSDEGFGVHTINYLENNYFFPDNIRLHDGGTAGIYMAPFLEECDPIFVIDAVNLDDKAGSIHKFHIEDVKKGNINLRMSPHQLGLLEIIDICKLRGNAPKHIEFFCVVPKSMEMSLQLSNVAKPQVSVVSEIIVNKCIDMGNKVIKHA